MEIDVCLPQNVVRHDWHFTLMNRLQAAVGAVATADPLELQQGFDELARQIPHCETVIERALLRDCLRTFCLDAACEFHDRFHRLYDHGACACALGEGADSVWRTRRRADPASLLRPWVAHFVRAFERDHRWPSEQQAAAILRQEFRQRYSLAALARRTGVSRAVLTTRFRKRFGVSPGEYHRRLRTEEALRLLRETTFCVDAVAREVGWGSTKNLYAALTACSSSLHEIQHPASTHPPALDVVPL